MTGFVKKVLSFFNRINDGIHVAQKVVLIIAGILMVGINFVAVLGRYLFKFSFAWHQESSIVLFAVIILLGANLAVRDDDEIKIELLKFKNLKAQYTYKAIIDVLGLAVIIVMIISSLAFVSGSFARPNYYSILKFKYAYTYSLLIVCFVLLALGKIELLFRRLDALCSLKEEKES